ncbi:hypothetical protein L195_g015749 [Trifolium pratense]|uniref:Uncharacterized protein n=1 Tax=Trifolium pratense TaxID=57577 RepID=A0A2K3MPH4_TRIPR|nr:hypothetical protein L195_g015749 [Trifolium pratense]
MPGKKITELEGIRPPIINSRGVGHHMRHCGKGTTRNRITSNQGMGIRLIPLQGVITPEQRQSARDKTLKNALD